MHQVQGMPNAMSWPMSHLGRNSTCPERTWLIKSWKRKALFTLFQVMAAGKQRRWDVVSSHSSVGVIIYHTQLEALLVVRQFRPAVSPPSSVPC